MAAGYTTVGWYTTRERRPPGNVHHAHPRCARATTTTRDRGDSRATTCPSAPARQVYHSALDGRTATGYRATSDDSTSAHSNATDSHLAWTLAESRYPGR